MGKDPKNDLFHSSGEIIFLSPRRVSPFLAWGDFHARSRFARSTIPEVKWGTTRSLAHRGKIFLNMITSTICTILLA